MSMFIKLEGLSSQTTHADICDYFSTVSLTADRIFLTGDREKIAFISLPRDDDVWGALNVVTSSKFLNDSKVTPRISSFAEVQKYMIPRSTLLSSRPELFEHPTSNKSASNSTNLGSYLEKTSKIDNHRGSGINEKVFRSGNSSLHGFDTKSKNVLFDDSRTANLILKPDIHMKGTLGEAIGSLLTNKKSENCIAVHGLPVKFNEEMAEKFIKTIDGCVPKGCYIERDVSGNCLGRAFFEFVNQAKASRAIQLQVFFPFDAVSITREEMQQFINEHQRKCATLKDMRKEIISEVSRYSDMLSSSSRPTPTEDLSKLVKLSSLDLTNISKILPTSSVSHLNFSERFNTTQHSENVRHAQESQLSKGNENLHVNENLYDRTCQLCGQRSHTIEDCTYNRSKKAEKLSLHQSPKRSSKPVQTANSTNNMKASLDQQHSGEKRKWKTEKKRQKRLRRRQRLRASKALEKNSSTNSTLNTVNNHLGIAPNFFSAAKQETLNLLDQSLPLHPNLSLASLQKNSDALDRNPFGYSSNITNINNKYCDRCHSKNHYTFDCRKMADDIYPRLNLSASMKNEFSNIDAHNEVIEELSLPIGRILRSKTPEYDRHGNKISLGIKNVRKSRSQKHVSRSRERSISRSKSRDYRKHRYTSRERQRSKRRELRRRSSDHRR